jgi:2'-5' RNA ligase
MTATREERPRLFIAIEMPETWRDAIAAVQDQIRRRIAAERSDLRLRFVRPEGVHLTLKFLGETPAARLASVEQALANAVPAPPAFQLKIGRIGSFSDRRAPAIIWAGIEPVGESDAKGLRNLVEQVETCLATAGFPRERRGFVPHLTLARVPDRLSQPDRDYLVATSQTTLPALEPITVSNVSLMRSHLGPGGARYERLAAFPRAE